jgi:chromate transporter
MKELWKIFLTFLKIGAFTFGGGYAMIPLIQKEAVENHKWVTDEDILNVVAIAESTPGPIAINCATFVGYKQAGIKGSIVATAAMVLPSFVIIYLISTVFDQFLLIPVVANAFRGIQIGVGILIFRVALTMLQKMQKKPFPRIVAGCAFAVMLLVNLFSLRLSTIVLLLLAGAVGIIVFACKRKAGEAK